MYIMYVYTLYVYPLLMSHFTIEANSEKPAETAAQPRGFLARELSTLAPPFSIIISAGDRRLCFFAFLEKQGPPYHT